MTKRFPVTPRSSTLVTRHPTPDTRHSTPDTRPSTLDTRPSSPITAFIALGSNLDDPPAQIHSALRALAAMPETRLVRASSLYRNPPVGYLAQPDFVNAAAVVETRLAPRELLEQLLVIEHRHGRVRDFPNAPRPLDLDIALYGERVIREPGLTIPHPRLLERAFVLVPLAEIAPDAIVPGRGRVADLLRGVDTTTLVKLTDDAAADDRR